jgi:hypothetical protein
MKPILYLAPQTKVRRTYPRANESSHYVSGNSPEPVAKWFTSIKPGQVHVDLFNGEHLTVQTGKGYLLGIHEVETPAILARA